MERFHSQDLRKGRYSERHRIYLVTTTTLRRQPSFRDFAIARALVQCLMRSDAHGSTKTLAFVVMPDHLHWLFELHGDHTLAQAVGAAKSVSSHRARRALWQAGFHEHAVRREDDVRALARYVVANPLRARLVEKLGDYPHWDAIWL